MMEIILRPGLHKTGKGDSLCRSTGLLPHKDWIMDGDFAIAITILMRLFNRRFHIDFYRNQDPSLPPPWQEFPLIDPFTSASGLFTAYKSTLRGCDVSWGKVTHLRTMAIEFASQHGCSRGLIASLSKHKISSLDDCYVTELHPDVLKVMAGFEKKEHYDIKRSRCTIPANVTWEAIVKCFIPRIDEWREQQNSLLGDNAEDLKPGGKMSAARNLLHHLLPMMVKHVFNTGIYVTTELPNHAISHFITGCLRELGMGNWYPAWAASERARIDLLR
jgi:hypothetical protein